MRAPFDWQLRTRTLPLGARTCIAGILNLTPDSFSDGGQFATTQAATDHALRLLDEGADVLDLGGESTRPGAPALTAEAISAAEEQRRVLPVLTAILRARPEAIVSVDTYRASTALAALDAGAEIVNDVSGLLWDQAMAQTVAEAGCGVVLMHTRGLPIEWAKQEALPPEFVLPTVLEGLSQRLHAAADAGVVAARIVLDPGFGFGKRGAENWALLAGLNRLSVFGRPLLAGLSRKGFLTAHHPSATLHERDGVTHVADTAAVLAGAHVLRVHDVRGARRAAEITDALLLAGTASQQMAE